MTRPIILAFVLLQLLTVAASAETVFDTFGIGDSYNSGAYGFTTYQAGLPPWTDEMDANFAMAFTVDAGGAASLSLGEIVLALALNTGDNEVDVVLTTNAAGLPGAVMESWHLSGGLPAFPGYITPIAFTSVTNPNLTDGQTYWVVVSASGPSDSEVAWYLNSVGYVGSGASLLLVNGSGSWVSNLTTTFAMRVTARLDPVSSEGMSWSKVKSTY